MSWDLGGGPRPARLEGSVSPSPCIASHPPPRTGQSLAVALPACPPPHSLLHVPSGGSSAFGSGPVRRNCTWQGRNRTRELQGAGREQSQDQDAGEMPEEPGWEAGAPLPAGWPCLPSPPVTPPAGRRGPGPGLSAGWGPGRVGGGGGRGRGPVPGPAIRPTAGAGGGAVRTP